MHFLNGPFQGLCARFRIRRLNYRERQDSNSQAGDGGDIIEILLRKLKRNRGKKKKRRCLKLRAADVFAGKHIINFSTVTHAVQSPVREYKAFPRFTAHQRNYMYDICTNGKY